MVIGVLQFELLIHGSESLKDKRRVVRSVKDRLHREHQVSVAEVSSQDSLTVARMGLALVGTDGSYIGEVLDRISAKLRSLPDAELGDATRRILHASDLEGGDEGLSAEDEAAIAKELLDHYKRGEGPR